MPNDLSWWIGFNVFVLLMLALDLGVFHRTAHVVSIREALTWTGIWVALALIFNAGIALGWVGDYPAGEPRQSAALQFLTGYLVEKALSVDNVFVFAIIFSYFAVPAVYQHRVLFYGILGALVMRAIMIFSGIALIQRFHWVIYVFGAILIASGIKLLLQKDEHLEPEKNPVLRLMRRLLPVSPAYDGQKFFTRLDGKRCVTPLFVVLLFVEWTDLVFAVDSIPAILAISQDSFIVYTSNVFAILGLRSLYFALGGMMGRFAYLKTGLSAVLVFIGIKLLLIDIFKVPTAWSLGVVVVILTASVVASLLKKPARHDT